MTVGRTICAPPLDVVPSSSYPPQKRQQPSLKRPNLKPNKRKNITKKEMRVQMSNSKRYWAREHDAIDKLTRNISPRNVMKMSRATMSILIKYKHRENWRRQTAQVSSKTTNKTPKKIPRDTCARPHHYIAPWPFANRMRTRFYPHQRPLCLNGFILCAKPNKSQPAHRR